MSIPTSAGFDMVIKPFIEQKARQIGEKMIDKCKNCGTWYITSRDHHDEEMCVECAGIFRSWDKKAYRERQKQYARDYRNGSKCKREAIYDQNGRVNDSFPNQERRADESKKSDGEHRG